MDNNRKLTAIFSDCSFLSLCIVVHCLCNNNKKKSFLSKEQVAQWVGCWSCVPEVVGSNPTQAFTLRFPEEQLQKHLRKQCEVAGTNGAVG